MTSLRQIESNRRNAQRSTGPKTQSGKARSSQNAVRHGLTAETVIGPLENPADYRAFEQAVTTAYDAETAVERELVLRLASLLWRLRRATSVEAGSFEFRSWSTSARARNSSASLSIRTRVASITRSPHRSCRTRHGSQRIGLPRHRFAIPSPSHPDAFPRRVQCGRPSPTPVDRFAPTSR